MSRNLQMPGSSSTASLNLYMSEHRSGHDLGNESFSQQSQDNDISQFTVSECQPSSLQARIKHLEGELKDAQADKEFVWSLWRQLQASNPDLTGAISCAIQREKEKAEQKDKKVLEILSYKDEQIEELQKSMEQRKAELAELTDKLKSRETELSEKQDELNFSKMNLKTSTDKEQMYEQMIRLRDDKIEGMISRIKELEAEVGSLRSTAEQYRQSAEIMDKQVRQTTENYEKLVGELNQFRLSIDNSLKSENEKLKSELKTRVEQSTKQSGEFEQLLAKLNSQVDYVSQQEKLIKQLKQMQVDLQQTIRAQQATQETLETENRELKRNYDEIVAKYERCLGNEKRLMADVEAYHSSSAQIQQLKFNREADFDLIKAQKFEIEKLRLQINLQTEQLDSKQALIEELEHKLGFFEDQLRNAMSRKNSRQINEDLEKPSRLKRSRSVMSHRPDHDRIQRYNHQSVNRHHPDVDPNGEHKRSKSVDKRRSDENQELDYKSANKIKQFYEKLLESKDNELNALRDTHRRRLERLISLEKEHKLLLEHVELLEAGESTSDNPVVKNEAASKDQFTIGYKRKDNESLWKEIKLIRGENNRLKSENLGLKEACDLFKVKLSEKMEEIEALQLELNVNINQKQVQFGVTKLFGNEKSVMQNRADDYRFEFDLEALENTTNEHERHRPRDHRDSEFLENELKKSQEKIASLNQEVAELRAKQSHLESKCSDMTADRLKYVNLSTQLTQENKKLYKKWFNARRNANKAALNERLKRVTQSQRSSENKSREKSSDISYLKLNKQLELRVKEFMDELKSARTRYEDLAKTKLELDSKIVSLMEENAKFKRDYSNLEHKLKSLKSQNESLSEEVQKKDAEIKEREKSIEKQEEQVRDELRKNWEKKLKDLNGELNRQSNTNKSLKQENDKLQDRVRLAEEKLNHTERDNQQKKQLIDFYKKKLDEVSPTLTSVEKDSAVINDCKQQLKKCQEANEKLKAELKTARNRAQSAVQDKQTVEEALEKANNELSLLKKEKIPRLESSLKQSKAKINDLEGQMDSLGQKAENKLKSLAETSQQTVDLAQVRLKYAYKIVENYEKTMKLIYSNLITRLTEISRDVREHRLKSHRQKRASVKPTTMNIIDENMRNAIDLASTVLNLTQDELGDILSPTKPVDQDLAPVLDVPDPNQLLFEFEQYLNAGKREKKLMMSHNVGFESNYDDQNQAIVGLVSQRLSEVLSLERELASLKTSQKSIS